MHLRLLDEILHHSFPAFLFRLQQYEAHNKSFCLVQTDVRDNIAPIHNIQDLTLPNQSANPPGIYISPHSYMPLPVPYHTSSFL